MGICKLTSVENFIKSLPGVKWSVVPGLLVPFAVVIVAHDVNVVLESKQK
jgi:hypothetical protein